MRVIFPIAILLSFFPAILCAQKLQVQGGVTLGITTPGPMRWLDRRIADPYPDPTAKSLSLLSPLVGMDASFTLWRHLAVNVGLHGSETGYTHEHSGAAGIGMTYRYQERMRLRQLSLPLTVGYAFRLGNVRVRTGAGYAFTYFVSGHYQSEYRSEHSSGSAIQSKDIEMFADDDLYSVYAVTHDNKHPRRQAQFRLMVIAQPHAKWQFGFAANSGYTMEVYANDPVGTGPENYVRFATDAYELTATYLLW